MCISRKTFFIFIAPRIDIINAGVAAYMTRIKLKSETVGCRNMVIDYQDRMLNCLNIFLLRTAGFNPTPRKGVNILKSQARSGKSQSDAYQGPKG